MSLLLSAVVEGQRHSWPLEGDVMNVGRSSRNHIQLADGTVSKEHAEIVREGATWKVRDLGSRNGTRVNGTEAREALPLADGDMVEFGKVQVQVGGRDARATIGFSDSVGLGSSVRVGARDILSRTAQRGLDAPGLVELLSEAGRMLVLPRPLAETCEELLRMVERAVPARRLVILLRERPDAEPVQVAVRHLGVPTREPLALSRTILSRVLDDCEAVVTRDAGLDPRFQGQASVIAQSIRSAMAVPLFDNEQVLGVLYADTTDPRVEYDRSHLEVFTVLANMAAVKITNARLLESEASRRRMAEEVAAAVRIQRSLLTSPPTVEGVTCVARIETCHEVGGDLYDLHLRPDGSLVVVVGDVSGKGMGAALLMSSTLSSARVLYDACDDPARLVAGVSNLLHRTTEAGRFVTLFVGFLEPETGRLVYCSAGHNPPLVIGAGEPRELAATGIPAGMLGGFPYISCETRLERGEMLALYTDGIPEAMHEREFFGDERLVATLREHAATPDLEAVSKAVLERVYEFQSGEARSDDITLVLLRRDPA